MGGNVLFEVCLYCFKAFLGISCLKPGINAPLSIAFSQQTGRWHRYDPLPGSFPSVSTTMMPWWS
ncbi:MAG: hypothetical protein CM1200mP22_17330 [Dehalococcoidia bacterium]|nr:MAG: hypothetical protein CM1200mP22_17330 [Dehalococcoidia bacterium]